MNSKYKRLVLIVFLIIILIFIGFGFYFGIYRGSKNVSKIPIEIENAIKNINSINEIFTNGTLDYQNDKTKYVDARGYTCSMYHGDTKVLMKNLNEVYYEPFSLLSNFVKIKRNNEEVIYVCKEDRKTVKQIDINKIVLLNKNSDKREYTFDKILIKFKKIDNNWKTDLPIVIYE